MGLSDSFSLLQIFIAVAALFFAIGVGLMSSSDTDLKKASFRGFLFGTFILSLSTVTWSCTVLDMMMWKRYTVAGISLGLAGLFMVWVASILGIVPKEVAVAQTDSNATQKCTGNCSFNQSGGTVIQNFNQEPQRLSFSEQLASALAAKMTGNKPLVLRGIGGAHDQEIVGEYARYFASRGIQVKLYSIGMLVPPPDRKVELRETNANYELTIAPDAF